MTAEEFRRVTEVTYLGYVYGTLAALRRMLPRDRGTIVQVGSALAYRGIPLQSAYCGAKHAIQGFTESLRCELLHDGATCSVTMVQLPALNTPQFGWVKIAAAAHAAAGAADLPAGGRGRGDPARRRPPHRREYWVGLPTAATLADNALCRGCSTATSRAPGSRRSRPRAARPGRPVNLWEPVDRDHDFGAHGIFDDTSHPRSSQLWASQHHGAVAAGLAAAAALGLAVWRQR